MACGTGRYHTYRPRAVPHGVWLRRAVPDSRAAVLGHGGLHRMLLRAVPHVVWPVGPGDALKRCLGTAPALCAFDSSVDLTP